MGKFFKIAEHGMSVGSMVKDVNPSCPHHGAEGKVVKSYPHQITFIVVNKGPKYKPGDKLTKTVDQMEKIAIGKTDPTKRPPRINNIALANFPTKSTVGKAPEQFPMYAPEAKYNNMSKKANVNFKEDTPDWVKDYVNAILAQEAKQSPTYKMDRRGKPITTIDSPLTDDQLDKVKNIHNHNLSELKFKSTPKDLLWNEYKGSLTKDQFEKMLKDKKVNIDKQIALDKNEPEILEFGPGGKRMVKDDSYSDLTPKNLNKPVHVRVLTSDDYNKKVSPRSVGVYNPMNRQITLKAKHVKKDQDAGYASDVTSHELRHALHPVSNSRKIKANKDLYKDYPEQVRDRHVHDAYVNNPDPYQTDHHLVDLGLLHSLYVKHGNKPVINDVDTDNFMKWYKGVKDQRKSVLKDGHLFKFDPESKLDEKFMRRNMKLVVDKPVKEQRKLASLGFEKIAITPALRLGQKGLNMLRKGTGWAAKNPGKTGYATADILLEPGAVLAKKTGVKTKPNIVDDWFFMGFPLTAGFMTASNRSSSTRSSTSRTDEKGRIVHPGASEVKKNKDGSYSQDASPGQYEDHGINRYYH